MGDFLRSSEYPLQQLARMTPAMRIAWSSGARAEILMTWALDSIPLLPVDLQAIHWEWHGAYDVASEYDASMAMATQENKWNELMRATKNTLMADNVRCLRYKMTQESSATLLLIACIFRECISLLIGIERKGNSRPSGVPFWTGELF